MLLLINTTEGTQQTSACAAGCKESNGEDGSQHVTHTDHGVTPHPCTNLQRFTTLSDPV